MLNTAVTIGFIDNDILLKLVAFQLFDEAMASLNLAKNDLQVLPTAKFVFFQLRRQPELIYSDDILARAIALVENCPTLPDIVNTDESRIEAQQLETFDEIHQGEARLILATRDKESFLLISGDKNCMKALFRLPDETYQRLCGRVVCLEQIMLRMIDVLGFDEVCDRIYPVIQYDKAIHLCFGYSEPAPKAQVQGALQSCLNEIHRVAPGLLMNID